MDAPQDYESLERRLIEIERSPTKRLREAAERTGLFRRQRPRARRGEPIVDPLEEAGEIVGDEVDVPAPRPSPSAASRSSRWPARGATSVVVMPRAFGVCRFLAMSSNIAAPAGSTP